MAETLIMLHGFTGSGDDWDALRPHFSAQYTIITPDIVGHGAAPKPQNVAAYTMQAAIDDVLALTDAPFHLLGYSMGGRLALSITAAYPERVLSLVLESASPGLQTQAERAERRQRDDALAERIEDEGMAWFTDFWASLALWDSQNDEQKAQLSAKRRQNDPIGLANSLRGMGTGVMPPLWDALPQITIPTLLIAGALDTKFVNLNRQMAAPLPDAQLQIIEDAGHTVHLEQPEAFAQRVSAFLQAR